MAMYYAGIGSRSTPPDVLELMIGIGARLAEQGYVLRSGHAEGADQAFEEGAGGQAEIYLPWHTFNDDVPVWGKRFVPPTHDAMMMARHHHPAWDRLSQAAQKLHARNSHQVLGYTLDRPSKFIICWTPGASAKGGTGQAIRIARYYKLRVFDLADATVRARLERFALEPSGTI